MVRPDRFELPTFWFVAMNAPRINMLAGAFVTTNDSQMLLGFMDLRDSEPGTLATLRNASMQGVGTELGTRGDADTRRAVLIIASFGT